VKKAPKAPKAPKEKLDSQAPVVLMAQTVVNIVMMKNGIRMTMILVISLLMTNTSSSSAKTFPMPYSRVSLSTITLLSILETSTGP